MAGLPTPQSAFMSTLFIALARFVGNGARKCCRNLLAAMRESRAGEAAHIIAHYRHLVGETHSASLFDSLDTIPLQPQADRIVKANRPSRAAGGGYRIREKAE